jgi:hypothetical protein
MIRNILIISSGGIVIFSKSFANSVAQVRNLLNKFSDHLFFAELH